MSDTHDERHDVGTFISDEEFAAAMSPPDLRGRINLRLEAALQQELEDIAEDTRYPLKSVSEVVRFCCIEGINKLNQWKKRPTLLGAIRAANALASRDRMQMEAADLLEKMDERIAWYIAKREFDEAVTLVGQMRSFFETLDEEFWSRYIRTEIDSRFVRWFEIIDKARKDEA